MTGVLPIALEKATKITQYLLTAGKEYVAIAHFHKKISEEKIKQIFSIKGVVEQTPPLKSAVKRVKRKRSIYYIKVLEIDDQDVLFKIGCEAGFYIRKFIHDIGKQVQGAHMKELRRTKAGPFDENQRLVTLQDLSDAYYFYKKEDNDKFLRWCIQPVENAVSHLPKIWVTDYSVDSICNGAQLKVKGISKLNNDIKKNKAVAVMTLKNELVSIGKSCLSSLDMLKKEKGVAVITNRVFMERGLYPKYLKAKGYNL